METHLALTKLWVFKDKGNNYIQKTSWKGQMMECRGEKKTWSVWLLRNKKIFYLLFAFILTNCNYMAQNMYFYSVTFTQTFSIYLLKTGRYCSSGWLCKYYMYPPCLISLVFNLMFNHDWLVRRPSESDDQHLTSLVPPSWTPSACSGCS